jgi:predicted transcriptional regulator
MDQIAVRLPDDLLDAVDAAADEQDVSRSVYIRDTLERRVSGETDQRVRELEQEVERLNRERRQLLEQREENQQLRRYVENDVEWHEASLPTRLRWYVFGKD